MLQTRTPCLNTTGSPVTASLSGTTITMTAKTVGVGTDYAVSGSSTTSFAASSTTLAGGTDPGGLYAPLATTYAYEALGNLTNVTQARRPGPMPMTGWAA